MIELRLWYDKILDLIKRCLYSRMKTFINVKKVCEEILTSKKQNVLRNHLQELLFQWNRLVDVAHVTSLEHFFSTVKLWKFPSHCDSHYTIYIYSKSKNMYVVSLLVLASMPLTILSVLWCIWRFEAFSSNRIFQCNWTDTTSKNLKLAVKWISTIDRRNAYRYTRTRHAYIRAHVIRIRKQETGHMKKSLHVKSSPIDPQYRISNKHNE